MLKPLGNRVIVKPDMTAEKTEYGIYLPVREKKDTGEVIGVGDPVTGLAPGDRITYSRASAVDLEYDGIMYEIVKADMVQGIL